MQQVKSKPNNLDALLHIHVYNQLIGQFTEFDYNSWVDFLHCELTFSICFLTEPLQNNTLACAWNSLYCKA